MITVTFPGLVLPNVGNGEEPFLTGIDGWYDSVEPRIDLVEYERDGAYDQDPVYDRPRSIVIAGEVAATTVAMFMLQRQVMSLKAIPTQFPLTVTDPLGSLTAMVRVSGRIEFEPQSVEGWATFEIPLLAIDPRKYGPETVASTGLASTAGGLTFPLGATRVDPFFPADDLYPSDTLFPSGDI